MMLNILKTAGKFALKVLAQMDYTREEKKHDFIVEAVMNCSIDGSFTFHPSWDKGDKFTNYQCTGCGNHCTIATESLLKLGKEHGQRVGSSHHYYAVQVIRANG